MVQPKGYKENPVLLPIPPSQRFHGVIDYTWMMFGLNVCIAMFFLGPIAQSMGLSPLQAAVGAFIGNLAATVVIILNGYIGMKYGISYPVHLRPSWGFRGAEIAVVLRGIVGAGWYGVDTYNASLAIIIVTLYIIGYGHRNPDLISAAAFKYVGFIVFPFVIAVAYTMLKGLKAIGKVADWAGPVLVLYFLWLLVYLHGKAPLIKVPKGVPWLSMSFLTYLAIQTNWWATIALNISDLSRGVYKDKRGLIAVIVGPLIGIVLMQVVGTLLSYYLVVYSKRVVPQTIILYGAPGAVGIILGELFVILAPFTTAVTADVPPLVDILVSTFKMRMKTAAIAVAVIGFILAPWWAVKSAMGIVNYVEDFAVNYGIILGPIAGIMLADYFILRRGRGYDLQLLYTKGPEGYWYRNGFSISAILSFVITIAIIYAFSAAIHQIYWTGPIPWPTCLSWYLAVIIALLLKWGLAKMFHEDKP